ncbi:MAG: NYN domain-containing protein [Candidatus Omnitrophica bacterium]|nr:NYN domain-containing protein [Candidatus Omnitrophota bacterium]
MKKTFIIDGYNVIHKIPELCAKLEESLESARDALVIEIQSWKRRYADSKAYIVFDGKNEDIFDDLPTRILGIDCVFTRSKESADDRIISMVRNAEAPSLITVISDDNQVRNGCRMQGAQVQYSSFISINKKKPHRPVNRINNIDNNMQEQEITDYYKKHLINKGIL